MYGCFLVAGVVSPSGLCWGENTGYRIPTDCLTGFGRGAPETVRWTPWLVMRGATVFRGRGS